METEFDIIVVGAGLSGGLPAAAYLQRAGMRVALVEQGARPSTFFRSYARGAGARFDVSPVNFSCMSPALVDLELLDRGYEIDFPGIAFSTIDGSGRTVTFHADLDATAAELAHFSARDAETFRSVMGGLRAVERELLGAAFFTPEPDLTRALELTAPAVGLGVAELWQLDAPTLVERLFEADAVRVALTALPAINLFGDLLAPGAGALAWLWTFLLRTCRAVGGASSLPDALERRFRETGGTLLLEAHANRLVRNEDRACRGVEVDFGRRRELLIAHRAVVSNLGAPLTSTLLGEELRAGWRTAERTVFTADVVLDRPLAWPTDGMRRSQRVYLLWPDWERCREWLQAAREAREDVFLGHLELTQFHVLYGAGAAGCPLRVRFGTGPFLDDTWDTRRDRYERAVRDVVARLDPDVTIRSLDLVTPLDYWRINPAARHGNPVGGDFTEGQWLGERLPYRTHVPGLYLSNSVWPTPLSWMAPGYNAACAVAEDLGIRDQPWWTAAPLAALPPADAKGSDAPGV